ncbi:MAG: DUF1269 domain-containing protein [Ardenticatenaceae bacterium]|nr:DUF1269 domain-containing protein [Ardenticatenaceae bacterium]
MPSDLSNQAVRGSGGSSPGASINQEKASQLIVVTFADPSQAQGMYEALVELDKKKLVDLKDAVFVTKDADGQYVVDEKFHNEKSTAMGKGAVFGALVGLAVGGPILGLAGGAVVGRFIGKRMDLGIDSGTIQSIANDLEQGHTALFILGYAKQAGVVRDVFGKFQGHIIETTLDTDVRDRLQRALDS